jgi:rod shape-determining protein MreC
MLSGWINLFNRDLLALVCSVILSFFLLFSNESEYIEAFESDISDIYSFLSSPREWYVDILATKEKNELLIQQITQMKLLYAQNENFRVENLHLKEMLNFAKSSPLSLIPANITNQYSTLIRSIILDVGEEDYIQKNQPVIDMNGVMGKTISVGKHATKVQLITDKNFRISIRIGDEKSLGIFIPTHGKYGILDGVRKSMKLNEGEIAYTSGISDIYPANIPVAKVISVNKNTNSPFQDVNVEILTDLHDLNYVFVVQ